MIESANQGDDPETLPLAVEHTVPGSPGVGRRTHDHGKGGAGGDDAASQQRRRRYRGNRHRDSRHERR